MPTLRETGGRFADGARKVWEYVPESVKRQITKKRLAVAAAVLAACGTAGGVYCVRGGKTAPTRPDIPTAYQTMYLNAENLYGPESAAFALRSIKNGVVIHSHPAKEPNLDATKSEIQQTYPNIRPLRLFGFIDEYRELPQLASLHDAREKVLAAKTKYRHYLPISFVIAALSNEGHSLDLDNTAHTSTNGFDNYGNDTFGSEFERIKRAGFVDDDFANSFSRINKTNEKGVEVVSAQFKSRDAAFRATVAMLAYNQYLFYEDLQKKGIPLEKLSGDERLFYTYYYYDRGPNSIDSLFGDEADVHRFFQDVQNSGAKANAYMVLTGAKWLEMNGSLCQDSKSNFWWKEKTIPKTTPAGVELSDLEIPSFRFDNARVTKPWFWLLTAARERGWKGRLSGAMMGLRTYDQQKQLYILFKKGKGAPAFNPDGPNKETARHLVPNVKKKGLWAMAIDTDREEVSALIRIAAELGVRLHTPYAKEPWHVEAQAPFEAK